jgi:hypothetical protein
VKKVPTRFSGCAGFHLVDSGNLVNPVYGLTAFEISVE